MDHIKFGTDGWRAIIAKEYTTENVARVAWATALWLLKNNTKPTVVVGHDCRFAGPMFAEVTTKVLTHHGIAVKLAKGFVSTPMVSLGVVKEKAQLGVVITASHNPPEYNGYKLKGYFGGPLQPDLVQEIEDIIPESTSFDWESIKMEDLEEQGLLSYIDLESMYVKHVEDNFDLAAIKNCGLKFAYDAMYGAGQNAMKRILPETTLMHCEDNPSFMGQAPEPIHKNLIPFSNMIKDAGNINCGLATDGDADRIGLYNSTGEFVDSHHIIMLLIKYLVEVKKYDGKVVAAFSVTPRLKKLCDYFGLTLQVTKIGFKYVSGIMITEDVLLGGEESGGIAIKGHIPERDGIWMGLVVWEYMAKSGKTLEQLISEVYEIVGDFAFNRNDLHLEESVKQDVIKKCKSGDFKSFGDYQVKNIETIDGFKFHFDNNEWVMIRPSGTEPVLRVYAESSTLDGANAILEATKATVLA
jgi:phosphomannomutase